MVGTCSLRGLESGYTKLGKQFRLWAWYKNTLAHLESQVAEVSLTGQVLQRLAGGSAGSPRQCAFQFLGRYLGARDCSGGYLTAGQLKDVGQLLAADAIISAAGIPLPMTSPVRISKECSLRRVKV